MSSRRRCAEPSFDTYLRAESPLFRPEHPSDGRWQRGSIVEGFYLAGDEWTAWAEWYRALAELGVPPMRQMPRDLWRFDVRLEGVADLSSDGRLSAVGLPPWFRSGASGRSSRLWGRPWPRRDGRGSSTLQRRDRRAPSPCASSGAGGASRASIRWVLRTGTISHPRPREGLGREKEARPASRRRRSTRSSLTSWARYRVAFRVARFIWRRAVPARTRTACIRTRQRGASCVTDASWSAYRCGLCRR